MRPYASKWGAVFQVLPAHILLPFLRCLLAHPCGGKNVAEVFAKQITAAISRLWLSDSAEQQVADEALLLLAELGGLLQPMVRHLLKIHPEHHDKNSVQPSISRPKHILPVK